MSPLTIITAALTEGVNPTEVDSTDTTVAVTLAEYGNAQKIARLLSLTSIDVNSAEKIEVLGQNMGESLDQLVRAELFSGGTIEYANSAANLNALVAGDKLDTIDLRHAVRTLKVNKAMPYADGSFLGKLSPYTTYDLMSDSVWVNAHTYKDGDNLYNHEIGKIFGVRVIESVNPKTETNSVPITVYSNFVHGDNAFGTFDLASDQPKLYIKTPGANSTDNSADRFSMIAWAGSYAVKTLNGNWVINIKSAAS